ncbi:MAG: recombination-associated protein RdgC [Desulfovibrio sp.]|nr:recombination-associated protein RdgC [Desulfovibrio sp.]
MGFSNSTCSFSRFRILDPVPDILWTQIADRLKQYAFHDIDNIPELEAHGWVSFEDMLDVEWLGGPPQKGSYIVFSLRQDLRRIPAGVIKKQLALAINEEKQRMSDQGKKFISRERKKELKEQVLLRLRSRFLPVPGEFNVVWATDRNEVWFASTQDKMIDLFMEQFLITFELHLEPLTPYNLAATLVNEEDLERLDKLEATQFTPLS